MARIRSVKPELATSLVVASWPIPVRYCFVLLWGYLDDKGRGLDIPKRIAGECYPHDDDITPQTVDEWLDVMTRGLDGNEGPVCRYEVDGRRYLHTVNADEHQKPNRPTPSKLPPCPLHEGLTEPLTDGPGGGSVPGGGGGDVDGGGGGDAPSPRCPVHRDDPNPPSCGRCKDHRIARERWDAKHAERQREERLAIHACRLCDGDGWRWHPDGKRHGALNERCDHRPLRSVS